MEASHEESMTSSPEKALSREIKDIPDQYEVAVAHTGGWAEEPFKDGQYKLSIESKTRILAAGVLAESGKIKELIISGGHTLGDDKPSEAQICLEYLLRKYPNLVNFPIVLEDSSIDTSENAENSHEILEDLEADKAIVLSSTSHLKRIQKNFDNYGVETYPMGAEFLMAERSKHHEAFAKKYLGSTRNLKNETLEAIFNTIMIVDNKGTSLRYLAHKMRK